MARKHIGALALLVFASGCRGSVKLDEVDGFGTVWSSVWFMTEYDDYDAHGITLSNVMGVCGKQQKINEEYEDILDNIEELQEDTDFADSEEVCEYYLSSALNYAELYDPMYPKGASYLSIGLSDDEGESEPDEEEYEMGEEFSFGLGISYYPEGNPYRIQADILGSLDCDDDDWVEDYEDEMEDYYDDNEDSYWYAEDGSVEITTVNDERSVKGTYEVDLLDFEGDDAGEATGSFSAKFCELEEIDYGDGYYYYYYEGGDDTGGSGGDDTGF